MNSVNELNLVRVQVMSAIKHLFDGVPLEQAHTEAGRPIVDLDDDIPIAWAIVDTIVEQEWIENPRHNAEVDRAMLMFYIGSGKASHILQLFHCRCLDIFDIVRLQGLERE